MAAADLQELRALVERAGGRRAVLLVAEVVEGAPAAPALAAFARDLLGDEAPLAPCPGPVPVPGYRARRAAGSGRRALEARLLLVLCGGGAARGRGARTRLREVVRDVRGRLPAEPPPAVVGVLLPGGDREDAAVLDAALRRHFPAPGTVQAARYNPGSPGDCRAAACRALRAALQHPAENMKDRERWRLPSFLQCISWNQRSWRKDYEAKAENNIHHAGVCNGLVTPGQVPYAGGYKVICRTLRKKWLWPAFPPMETVKKLLEAQAPKAAGHPTQSSSQICPVDLEQWEELVQALSSKD